jgi:hypothetical protein
MDEKYAVEPTYCNILAKVIKWVGFEFVIIECIPKVIIN